MGTVVSAPTPFKFPPVCLLLYFLLYRGGTSTRSDCDFLQRQLPLCLCHEAPSPQKSRWFPAIKRINKKCTIMIWKVMRLNEQIWSQSCGKKKKILARERQRRGSEREGKKEDIWQIYAAASAQTPAVWSVPTQKKHSCYHHPSTPATSLSSLHLGYSTNTVLALLS